MAKIQTDDLRIIISILLYSLSCGLSTAQITRNEHLFDNSPEIIIEVDPNKSHNHSYIAIDDFVLATNAEEFATVEKLVTHLTSRFVDEESKARSIYSWIAFNISYDHTSLQKMQKDAQDAVDVWTRKTAVCEGFANLFQEMSSIAGLESRVIKGYVKNVSIGNLKFPNHAWNSIKIEGKWKLLDVTWASVRKNEISVVNQSQQEKFNRFKLDYFYLIDPSQLILTHLPEDPYWQLQSNKVNIESFILGEEEIKKVLSKQNDEVLDFESLIASYEGLDSLDRSISYMERMVQNKHNRVKEYGLGVAYYYKARQILKSHDALGKYEINRLAVSYFEKSLIQLSAIEEEDYGYDFSKELAENIALRIEILQ